MKIEQISPKIAEQELLASLGMNPNSNHLYSAEQIGEIDEPVLLRQKLAECYELNRMILAEAPVGVLVYDPEGACIIANQTAATIVGGTHEQLTSQNFHHIHSWQNSGLITIVEQVIATGIPAHREIYLISTFGKDLWLDIRVSLLHANSKSYILLVIDDISAEKLAKANLALHQSLLEELVLARTSELAHANQQLQKEAHERKRAEEQTQYHATLLQQVNDAIIATDLEYHVTAWNRAAEEIYGWRADEVLGQHVGEILKTTYVGASAEAVLQQFMEAGLWQGEVTQQHKSGKPIYIMASVALVHDAAGNPVGAVAVNRDITERKVTQEELLVLSRSVEQSPVSIMITNTSGAIEYVNPRFTQLTGYSMDEVKGRNPRLLKSGDTSQAEYRLLWNTILSGKQWQGELHNRSKDGTLFWEAAAISPVVNASGQITHFVAIKEDITQRKQRDNEQRALLNLAVALREANNRDQLLSAILEHCAQIVDAPIAAFASHATDSGEMIVEAALQRGEPLHKVAIYLPAGQGISLKVAQSGEPYWRDDILTDSRFLLSHLVGDERAVGCVPLIVHGQTLGVIWVMRKTSFTADETRLVAAVADMAAVALQRASLHEQMLRYTTDLEHEVAARTHELASANERLQELDRLKSKFVSDVTHELRNPVGNIGLYLALMERKPEKQQEYMAILHTQVELLQKLVKETLDLSRIDQQRENLLLMPIDLNEMTHAVVSAHLARAEKQNLALHFEAELNLPAIVGDYDKLARVIMNLVANALNYTPSGQIRVRTYQAHDMVACEVKDTGCGIYPDDLPHLFDRFYRGKRDQMAPVPGTGLGLSIVKELVELHGGAIHVTSEVGVGSTFTVILPLPQAPLSR